MHTKAIFAVVAVATTLAGSTTVAQSIYPTRAAAFEVAKEVIGPVQRGCTQLERSARVDTAECGHLPLAEVALRKVENEKDGDE